MMERTKLFRAGKVIDFHDLLTKQMDYYKKEIETHPGEEYLKAMLRQTEHIIDQYEWWFGMGKYEKEEVGE